MPKKRPKETSVQPIPRDQVKAWNALVKETREVVTRRDATQFDLIILAGQVETEYGRDKIGRWAEEACVGINAARQYQWLARAGIDEAFIEKWCRTPDNPRGLSYSVIREIAGFHGSLKSDYALDDLKIAKDKKMTVVQIRGYMLEKTAPHDHKQEAAKSIRMALQDKQEMEGFSNTVKVALEKLVEDNPEIEEAVLKTVITDVEDLHQLKIAAGLETDHEADLVEKSRRAISKLKNYRKWFRENGDFMVESVMYGHELSSDLQAVVKDIHSFCEKIMDAEVPETVDDLPEDMIEEMEL